jgi:hypothetical protein
MGEVANNVEDNSQIDLSDFVSLDYKAIRNVIDTLIPELRGVVTLVNRSQVTRQDIRERILPYLVRSTRQAFEETPKYTVDLSYGSDLATVRLQFGPLLQKDSSNGYHV